MNDFFTVLVSLFHHKSWNSVDDVIWAIIKLITTITKKQKNIKNNNKFIADNMFILIDENENYFKKNKQYGFKTTVKVKYINEWYVYQLASNCQGMKHVAR